MILEKVKTPYGMIYNVTELDAREKFSATEDDIRAAKSERLLQELRIKRDGTLRSSDWTQLADAPLSDEQRQAWTQYRKALRDLPESVADLDKVEWPVAPV